MILRPRQDNPDPSREKFDRLNELPSEMFSFKDAFPCKRVLLATVSPEPVFIVFLTDRQLPKMFDSKTDALTPTNNDLLVDKDFPIKANCAAEKVRPSWM